MVTRLEVDMACQGRDCHLCGPYVARNGLQVQHMLGKWMDKLLVPVPEHMGFSIVVLRENTWE